MELLIRSSVGSGRIDDLFIDAEPDHSVGELADALAQHSRKQFDAPVTLALNGRSLSRDQDLLSSGLISGSEVSLVNAGAAGIIDHAGDHPVELAVTHGTAAGFRAPLRPGTYMVGRPQRAGVPNDYIAIENSSISLDHLRLEVSAAGEVRVAEKSDVKNRLLLDGALIEPGVLKPFAPGQTLDIGGSRLAVVRVQQATVHRVDQLGHLPFHRSPLRPSRPVSVSVPPLGKMPTRPEPIGFPVLSALLPLIGGIVMAALFRQPRLLFFTLLAPLSAAASWLEQRRRSRRSHDRDIAAFDRRLDERSKLIEAAVRSEVAARSAAAPSLAEHRQTAETRARSLWSRSRTIPEFLDLRLGQGALPTLIEIPDDPDGDDKFVLKAQAVNERSRLLPDAPITVPLLEVGVLGVVGSDATAVASANSLMIQAVCLHSPEDLVVAVAASEASGFAEWLKWVPHTRSTGSPLEGAHLATGKREADDLLKRLLAVAEVRLAATDSRSDQRWPWVLVLLERMVGADPTLVAQLLAKCPDAGMSVVWVTGLDDYVPPQCRAVANITAQQSAEASALWFTDPEKPVHSLRPDLCDAGLPDAVARALAPLRDASAGTLTTAIPRVVPLFTAHGVDAVTPQWLSENWAVDRTGDAGYALETTIGTTGEGPLLIDLVAHGPHGLIGGTSGAGKSELLQALVAGLLVSHSPQDVGLFFIDFKGGSASEAFKDLPHIAGRVTDLDEEMAVRAQIALRAELKSRVKTFAECGANGMYEMRTKARVGDVSLEQVPPSLVIIIDEFATLVKQLPAFVAELVDIAQRGRSYGIHLILATQRPSASVDDNILANTNLRISLRMLDTQESNSILGSPEAANIPLPLRGRALARLGPGRVVEFQSAYCSAPIQRSGGRKDISVSAFGSDPQSRPASVSTPRSDVDAAPTQLSELVTAILQTNAPRTRQVWTPVLPADLSLEDAANLPPGPAAPTTRDPGRHVLLGACDDPGQADPGLRQTRAELDLAASGGLVVAGTAGSGKTTVLATIAASAVAEAREASRDLLVFGIDYASGALAEMPECRAVATPSDLEVVSRVIETLAGEIEQRRQSGNAGSRPNVLLLIDGYPALASALVGAREGQRTSDDRWASLLQEIMVEGRSFGIYPVITAQHEDQVKSAVLVAVTGRLRLRQPQGNGPFVTASHLVSLLPGAGYLDGRRVQVARADAPPPRPVNDDPGHGALRTRALPDCLSMTEFNRAFESSVAVLEPGQVPVGIADLTLRPVAVDLRSKDLLVSGAPGSGKSALLWSIAEWSIGAGVLTYVIGGASSPLRSGPWERSGFEPEAVQEVLVSLTGALGYGTRALLVIDDFDRLSGLGDLANPLMQHDTLGVVASTNFSMMHNDYSNFAKRLRAQAEQYIYLQPESAGEAATMASVTRLPELRLGLTFPPGRGLLVRRGRAVAVQAVLPDRFPASEMSDGSQEGLWR